MGAWGVRTPLCPFKSASRGEKLALVYLPRLELFAPAKALAQVRGICFCHRASSQQTPKPERGAMPSKALAVFSAGPRTRKGGAEQDTKRETPHTRREQRESPPPTHTKQSPRANERQHTTHTQHAHQGASLQPRRSKGARQVGSVWNSRHMKLKKPGPGGWQVVGAFHSAAPAALVVTKHKMIAESHQLVQAADKIVRHSKKRTRGVHAVLRVLLASSLIVSFFQGPARL